MKISINYLIEVRLPRISAGLPGILFGKLEAFNPAGSVKYCGNEGKTIVTMLPHSGERYLSTQLSNTDERS